MKVSGHFNNCIMIIGWPIFRLERYFLGRKRNFLLHFARKSLHHHSIILVISDKHTHTGLMCRNTNHSRVRQTCRLSPLCYMYFSSKAMVFVSSTVQNWTELFMIIPHLLGPSPFEVIMVIFTISQHIPHLKRIIWNDHLNIKFEQWTSFGKNVELEVFKNKTPGSWVHWPFIYCALQCPGRGIFSSRKEMSSSMKCMIYTWYIAGSKIKIPPFYRAEGGDGWQSK